MLVKLFGQDTFGIKPNYQQYFMKERNEEIKVDKKYTPLKMGKTKNDF